MFCMAKKAVIGVAAAAVLSTLVFGRDALSYVKTFGSSARDAIKAEVPLEFEIQRARDMVGNLVPDIRKCMHVIAEEEVNVEHLSKDIVRAESELLSPLPQRGVRAAASDLVDQQPRLGDPRAGLGCRQSAHRAPAGRR